MFADVLYESRILNDIPLQEAADALMEAAETEYTNMTGTLGFLTDSATALSDDNERDNHESLISRMITKVKEFITNIIMWIAEKLHIMDARISIMVKHMEKHDVGTISIMAPKNAQQLDRIYLEVIEKAGTELRNFELTDVFRHINIKGGSVAELAKYIDKHLLGYVPCLAKYNETKIEDIKTEIFGEPVMQSKFNPSELAKQLKNVKKYKDGLNAYVTTYTRILTFTRGKLVIPDIGDVFPKFMRGYTAFFNRNITLITGLIGEYMGVILHIFTSLTAKIKEKSKPKEDAGK